MKEFVIECPSCGSYNAVKNGLFGTRFLGQKSVDCVCGYHININAERMTTCVCPGCGNEVVYDQAKGDKAQCPICKTQLNTLDMLSNQATLTCPSCSCTLTVPKSAETCVCPLCDTEINVAKQIEKEAAKNMGLASVIKYEGGNDVIVWKHPIEDFNLGSQLIVHESQEAIFFRDGQALDLFGAGRYTLSTQNLPALEHLYKFPTNTDTPFHSEVYFINLTTQMAMKWGTADKINIIDPTSQAPIAIGARGIFNVVVANSRKLLMKLVGTTSGLTREDLNGENGGNIRKYFRSILQVGVSSYLAQTIAQENTDILQIDATKMRLSEQLRTVMSPYFEDYGLQISEFLIEGIILPEEGELGYDVVQTLISLRQAGLKKQVITTEADIKMTELDAQKDLSIRNEQNTAAIEIAHRQAVVEQGQTDVLQAQLEGQKNLTAAQAEVAADRLRMQLEMDRKAQEATISAEEMRMKGYSQKDVIQGQVLTAFAENQPAGGGAGGFGGFSGMAGQAMQMGAGFATMGAAAGMASNMMGAGMQMGKEIAGGMTNAFNFGGNNSTAPGATGGMQRTMNLGGGTWNCPSCGCSGITSKFCPDCGTPKPAPVAAGTWNCPNCGASGITSKFCPECGAPRPAQAEPQTWNCPNCGATGITSKFCPECGAPKGGNTP
ncbi:MAG: SPFH domain-containing protein [Lachnospiraceae bacterium]|nr:SPFH domain-containing protein [Lachnospiraceae bacterium]